MRDSKAYVKCPICGQMAQQEFEHDKDNNDDYYTTRYCPHKDCASNEGGNYSELTKRVGVNQPSVKVMSAWSQWLARHKELAERVAGAFNMTSIQEAVASRDDWANTVCSVILEEQKDE